MNLEAIYYISQVVAAFALVGSLVFVGFQIGLAREQTRQANTTARSHNYLTVMEMNNMCQRSIVASSELADAFRVAMEGRQPEGQAVRIQLAFWFATYANVCMAAFRAERDNLYDAEHLEAGLDFLSSMVQQPFFREQWDETHAQRFPRDYVTHVESLLPRESLNESVDSE